MKPLEAVIISVLTTFVASSGFWTFLMTRREKKSASTRLLMGLAHDKILYLGMKHIEAGYITREDYEDIRTYLYEPYLELGGNGTAERVMREVSILPLHINKLLVRPEVPFKPEKGEQKQ